MNKSPDKPAYFNLTGKNLNYAILSLAIPSVFALMMESIHHLVDAFWVGRLGTDELAAVSGSTFLLWLIYGIAKMISVGLNSLIARRTGENNEKAIRDTLGNGLILTVFLAIIVMVPTLIFMDPIISATGLKGGLHSLTKEYFGLFVIFLPLIYISNALDAAFRGSGDTKTPMKMFVISVLINASLDPVLIFGFGPIPAYGIGGAAWATIIGEFFLVFGLFCVLWKRKLISSDILKVKPDYSLMKKMIIVGAPVTINSVIFSSVYIFLTRLISNWGPAPLAALGLGHRIESIAYFVAFGFHVAASTLTGQYMGAKNPQGAEKAALRTVLISLIPGIPVCLLFVLFPQLLARIFSPDPQVIIHAGDYIRIIGLTELFLFVESILQGAFVGAGNSLPPMIISVPLSILRIPLALFLSINMDLGPKGIWWAVSSTTAAKGLLMFFWFKRGRWKKMEL